MNPFKYYLIAGLLLLPLALRSQISNVQVQVNEEDEKIVITYDYAAQSESIDDIIVTYTTNDESKATEAKTVIGDVRGITPGKGKRIEWCPLCDDPFFSAENLVIHLKGVRDPGGQAKCDASLNLADRFFNKDKDYPRARAYYDEIINNCPDCNCHPKDILRAKNQIKKIDNIIKAQDLYHIAYFHDMPTVEDGSSMNGISAYLLRNHGAGYYASFRGSGDFYTFQGNKSYYRDEKGLKDDYTYMLDNYRLDSLGASRKSSWLFSTGLTFKLIRSEYASGYLYAGAGIGSNSIQDEFKVGESGSSYTENKWLTDGLRNLFFSPEVGVIGSVMDYVSVMAGLKYPLSLTSHERLKLKGISAMFGVGIKLKSPEKADYARAKTYVAYTIDLPDKTGSDKIQSINIIGISVGTISYNKLGAYFSARINPLLFNQKEVEDMTENGLSNYSYTGVYDHANAFGTVGFTWMYFYGGIGASYQKEFKAYQAGNAEEVWCSQREKVGLCTEFGLNLRLLDRLLLRGGFTFPDFKLSSGNNELRMSANKTFVTLGLGYVFK